jgi:Asp-tRNA(Asn)/Glu-tRNA(Gln) amidotransferase C subunit
MAKQTELFEQFCRDPEKIQQLLQFITIADRDLKRFDTPLPGEYSYWQKALADLQKPIGDGLFDINGEITTLQEIKDIRDELRMIEDVLRQQIKSVEMMYNVLERRQIYRADEMLQNIQGRIDIIKQLQQDARQAYDGVNNPNPPFSSFSNL